MLGQLDFWRIELIAYTGKVELGELISSRFLPTFLKTAVENVGAIGMMQLKFALECDRILYPSDCPFKPGH